VYEYDAALKSILTRRSGSVLTRLTGLEVARWHNSELPEVRSRRADLLGETLAGRLVHVELQSTNDSRMAERMLEYAIAIYRGFGQFPEQLVLYVGSAAVRMEGRVTGPGIDYRCRIVDIRDLDGEPLLESGSLADNIIAVLARFSDQLGAVRRILEKISKEEPASRANALAELMVLAQLRQLSGIIREECDRMPILNDIMDHEVFGPLIRGGRQDGERTVILRQMAERFGTVPPHVRTYVESLDEPELENIAVRLLKAGSLEELVP